MLSETPHKEEVQLQKGKGAQVAKRLIYGQDDLQVDLSGYLQGIHGGQTAIQIFSQKGSVQPPMLRRLNHTLVGYPRCNPPLHPQIRLGPWRGS